MKGRKNPNGCCDDTMIASFFSFLSFLLSYLSFFLSYTPFFPKQMPSERNYTAVALTEEQQQMMKDLSKIIEDCPSRKQDMIEYAAEYAESMRLMELIKQRNERK